MVREVTDSEENWRAVFQSMDIPIGIDEYAELEFRKATYKHKFDRQWYMEKTRIENEHYTIMGVILEFTKGTSSENCLKTSPLELAKNSSEYKFDIDLPFFKDISEELVTLLS